LQIFTQVCDSLTPAGAQVVKVDPTTETGIIAHATASQWDCTQEEDKCKELLSPVSLHNSDSDSSSAPRVFKDLSDSTRPACRLDNQGGSWFSDELAMSLSLKQEDHTQLHHNSSLHHQLLAVSGNNTTPFSVTDILSPLEAAAVYRNSTHEFHNQHSSNTSTVSSSTTLTSPPPEDDNQNRSPSYSTSGNNNNNNNNNSGKDTNTDSEDLQLHHSMNMNTSNSPYTQMHMAQLSHPGAAAFQAAQYCNGAADLHGMGGHYGDMRSSATAGWYGASATDPRFASKSDNFCTHMNEIFLQHNTRRYRYAML